jgi:hypothetical protein
MDNSKECPAAPGLRLITARSALRPAASRPTIFDNSKKRGTRVAG